jgi:arabinose-5-phosphate isomerase
VVENGAGIITDGDLRRHMEQDAANLMNKTAAEIMSPAPKTISAEARLSEAEELMNELKITALLVVEAEQIVGIIQIYDVN